MTKLIGDESEYGQAPMVMATRAVGRYAQQEASDFEHKLVRLASAFKYFPLNKWNVS